MLEISTIDSYPERSKTMPFAETSLLRLASGPGIDSIVQGLQELDVEGLAPSTRLAIRLVSSWESNQFLGQAPLTQFAGLTAIRDQVETTCKPRSVTFSDCTARRPRKNDKIYFVFTPSPDDHNRLKRERYRIGKALGSVANIPGSLSERSIDLTVAAVPKDTDNRIISQITRFLSAGADVTLSPLLYTSACPSNHKRPR